MSDEEKGGLDAYERGHLPATYDAFHQRTGVSLGLFLVIAIGSAVLAFAAASWKLVVVAVLVATWLVFSVLRVRVDADALVVHFGWMRRRIPLDVIRAMKPTTYAITGGVGILWLRRTQRGLVFAVPGSGGRALAVTFDDETGRRDTWILASREPEALRDAIRARLDRRPDRAIEPSTADEGSPTT